MSQQTPTRPTRARPTREERRRELRRRRRRAAAALVLVFAAVAAIIIAASPGSSSRSPAPPGEGRSEPPPHHRAPPASFGVGMTTLHFVDSSRDVLIDGSQERRALETVVYYPTVGGPRATVVPQATPAGTGGPFPLIVFGHGFEKLPQNYQPLLERWARAGYVVAAPVFPLENKDAAGGPNESDLPNEPQDMSFVITRMIEESSSAQSQFHDLIDTRKIAVSGQSDGGDAALAAAYDPSLRDERISAAVILSGAEIPMLGPFPFPSSGPALLAVQGTADNINKPAETYAYFAQAPRPKYLLRLTGAGHLPPYTKVGSQLNAVTRVSLAFLDGYLLEDQQALQRLQSIGSLGPLGSLTALP